MGEKLLVRRILQAVTILDLVAVIVTLLGMLWAAFADTGLLKSVQFPTGWWLVGWLQAMLWLVVRTTVRIRSLYAP